MTVRKRGRRRKNAWNNVHGEQLKHGWDFLHIAWGDDVKRDLVLGTWKKTFSNMREAYAVLRDQVMEGYTDLQPGRRPWGWWKFESEQPRDKSISEHEQLESMGLLTEIELAKLRKSAHGILNECHETPFRRAWSWWRFLSPQRRNRAISEIEQLCSMRTELTDRKRFLLDEQRDIYARNNGSEWGPCIHR